MGGNNESAVGKLLTCNSFVVTYYWSEPAQGTHLVTNLILIPILIVLSLIGVVINSLLIIAYTKNPRLKTLHSMLLVALACSDVLVSAIVEPGYVGRMVLETLGTYCCPVAIFYRLASYFSCAVSLLTVTIMTIERFITLAFPYRHHTIITTTRLKCTVTLTWIATFALVVAHIGVIPHSVLLSIGAFFTLSCLITVTTIWIWIHRLLQKHQMAIQTKQTPAVATGELRGYTKRLFRNTRTSYVVVAFVFISYFPVFSLMVYFASQDSVDYTMTFVVDPWAESLMLFNSLLNPLLVLWKNKEFRTCIRTYLPWYKHSHDNTIGANMDDANARTTAKEFCLNNLL